MRDVKSTRPGTHRAPWHPLPRSELAAGTMGGVFVLMSAPMALLAIVGGPLPAGRPAGALGGARVQRAPRLVRMGDEPGERLVIPRRLGISQTPHLAAIATKRKELKKESTAWQPPTLVAFDAGVRRLRGVPRALFARHACTACGQMAHARLLTRPCPMHALHAQDMSKGDILKYQLAGAFTLALIVANVVKGDERRLNEPDTLRPEFTARTEKAQKMLKAFKCEKCGYELYPARGREGKFFPDSFKCPMCGSPKESFYDMNDENDPRNWDEEEYEDDDDEPAPA